MITQRELQYVNSWARKAPYPGIDYAEKTAEKLVIAYKDFNKFYKDKQYDIITSSSDQILFEIQDKNLCHMLGIDYKNLCDEMFDEYRKEILGLDEVPRSYELLTSIIENIEDVLKYEYDNKIKILNYYRIMIKCSIFEKLSDFSKFNFGIIDFDKKKYEELSGSKFSGNTEKFLYVQSNEPVAPIFMMGILPEGKYYEDRTGIEMYAIESLMAPSNVKDFFNEQIVSIPTQILATTSDFMNKSEATPEEKIALLNQYKAIVKEYCIPNKLNIYGDYESILVEQSQNKIRKK